jgi:hypothetical protein
MSFFEVLFWMGMLCLAPIVVVVIRDAIQAARKEAATYSRQDPEFGNRHVRMHAGF